jgi:serine/threonine protein kinase
MFPIFNKQFQLVQDLGTGGTSKVYLAESLSNPEMKVAIKIYNR